MEKSRFYAGDNGVLEGASEILKPLGGTPVFSDIPVVKPHKGHKFVGWDISPTATLDGDRVCTAQYEQILPWYKKIGLWATSFFSGRGCLKWLLWILLFIILCWLLSWLFRGCGGNEVFDGNGYAILPEDDIDKIEQVSSPDGELHDNNGVIEGIVSDDGKLPENVVVSPIVGEDGQIPPVVSNPGAPDVIDNRLIIYFEDEHADLDKWAQDFKRVYPSPEYQIIGSDPNVRMIQILVPVGQRNVVREELPSKIPNQDFFVVDESIMTLHGRKSTSKNNVP